MRVLLVVCILLCATSARSEDAKLPTAIIYHIGGTMTPPKRIAVDLTTGILSEVMYSTDGHDSTNPFAPGTPIVRNLTSDQLKILRPLVDNVWATGVDEETDVPRCLHCSLDRPTSEKMEITASAIHDCSIDSVGRFEIVKAGFVKTYYFSVGCTNTGTDKLTAALWCDANPDPRFCKTP